MKKQLIIPAIIVGVIATGLTVSAILPNESAVEPKAEQSKSKQVVSKAEPVVAEPTIEVEVAEPAVAIEPVVVAEPTPEPTPAPEPVVLSTLEYGYQYLNLESPIQLDCFNTLIAAFPERFVEPVRERNVKALSVFAGVCAAGYDSYDIQANNRLFNQWGRDGEFFDSDLAKSRW